METEDNEDFERNSEPDDWMCSECGSKRCQSWAHDHDEPERDPRLEAAQKAASAFKSAMTEAWHCLDDIETSTGQSTLSARVEVHRLEKSLSAQLVFLVPLPVEESK